jgi:hypothetical protein
MFYGMGCLHRFIRVKPRGDSNSTATDVGIFLGPKTTGLPANWAVKAKVSLTIVHSDPMRLITESELCCMQHVKSVV